MTVVKVMTLCEYANNRFRWLEKDTINHCKGGKSMEKEQDKETKITEELESITEPEVTKEEETLEKPEVTKGEETPEKPEVTKAEEMPEKPEVTKEEMPEKPEVAKGENVTETPLQMQVNPLLLETEPIAKKKKFGKKFKVGVVAAVAALAVGGTAFAFQGNIKDFLKRNMSTTEEYYSYVEQKNRDKYINVLTENYEAGYGQYNDENFKQKVSYKMCLGEFSKNLIAMAGVDLSSFESVGFDYILGKEKDDYYINLDLLLNEENLLSGDMFMNWVSKTSYLQFPELSEAYLDLSSSVEEAIESMEDTEDAKLLANMYNNLPTTEQIETLANRYTNILFENYDTIEKSEEVVTLDEIEQEYLVLTATFNEKTIYNMKLQMLENLQSDPEIKTIIQNLDKDLYKQYKDSIKDSVQQCKEGKEADLSEKYTILMKVYVDKKGNIAGREITCEEANDLVISTMKVQKGSSFSYKAYVKDQKSEVATLHGTGTIEDGKMDGEYSLDVAESLIEDIEYVRSAKDLLVVKIEQMDLDKLFKEGAMNGTITLSTKAVPMAASYKIMLSMSGTTTECENKMSVMCGSESIVDLIVAATNKAEVEKVKVKDGDKIYDIASEEDMEAYVEEIDYSDIVDKISTTLNLEKETVEQAFEEIFASATESYQYSDYEEDYYEDDYYEDDYYEDDYYDDGYYEEEYYDEDSYEEF